MTALQSLGAPRPRGLAVGLTCFSGKGVGEHRLPVTALCRTPGRARVSDRARTDGSGSQDHGSLRTKTWPRRRPPLPPTAPCRLPVQEDSTRRPLAAEARLQSLGLALPAPGVHYGKCSPQCTAAAGRRGSRVWAEAGAGPDPGQGWPHPAPPSAGSQPSPGTSPNPKPGVDHRPKLPSPCARAYKRFTSRKRDFLSSLA